MDLNSDAQNATRVITHCDLHSKITPKRPLITPDHTRGSQERAFGTYFLTGPRQNSFSSLSRVTRLYER